MIQNIQVLRGIAAFLVVLHHFVNHYVLHNGYFESVQLLRHFTFFGVDIFFVISGYVIAMTTKDVQRGFSSALRFIRNRACRIYLGYWPFFFLMWLLAYRYQPGILEGVNYFKSFFLLTPATSELLLKISWTLSFELYFYVLCFFLFWVPNKALSYCVMFAFIAVLGVNYAGLLHGKALAGFLLSPYMLEFFSGYLLCVMGKRVLAKVWLLPVLLIFFIGLVLGINQQAETGLLRVVTFGVAGFCAVWLSLLLENSGKTITKGWLMDMGNASYTLYLSHIALIHVFGNSGLMKWLGTQHFMVRELGFALLLIVMVRFAIEFYRAVELPLYKKVRA